MSSSIDSSSFSAIFDSSSSCSILDHSSPNRSPSPYWWFGFVLLVSGLLRPPLCSYGSFVFLVSLMLVCTDIIVQSILLVCVVVVNMLKMGPIGQGEI
ncbi:hypothetical protein V2J09_017210 [Rumex salicifolius]